MAKYIEDFKMMLNSLRNHKMNMQQKLMLYFIAAIILIVGILFAVLSASGLLSFSQERVGGELNHYLQGVTDNMEHRFDTLNARGIEMAEQIEKKVAATLTEMNITFNELNDNPKALEKLQKNLYDSIFNTLNYSECSGAYVILDATANTKLAKDQKSASGIYLRRQSSGALNPEIPNMALYRGCKEVGRSNGVELHGRWALEFKTDDFPDFSDLIKQENLKAENSYYLTDAFTLPKTWEKIMLLCVPIYGRDGKQIGICGLELSDLYFGKYYQSAESDLGTLTTALVPIKSNTFNANAGMFSGSEGLSGDKIEIDNGRKFNTYTFGKRQFIGVQDEIKISAEKWVQDKVAVVLLPMESYRNYENSRIVIITVVLLFLMLLWLCISFYLSGRYVRPITDGIRAIRSGEFAEGKSTGHSEIDELVQFMKENKDKKIHGGDVPEGVTDIFNEFIGRVHTLTDAEYGIFKYYMDGYQIQDIPELAFISMSTVRKHNRNIYEKLGVSSRDEMMLYIDMLRKCGRIGEIIFNEQK